MVLVDADTRERTLSLALELSLGRGLWTALEDSAVGSDGFGLDAHLAPDAYTSLMILPQADGASPTRELYGHSGLRPLLDALKRRFDLVVLDCGPVGLVDGRMTAVQTDATVVVVCWNATLVRHLAVTRHGLERLGGVVPGIIVNGVAETPVRRWLGDRQSDVSAAL